MSDRTTTAGPRRVVGTLIDPWDHSGNKSKHHVGRFINLRLDKGQRSAGLLFPYFEGTLPVGFHGTFDLKTVDNPLRRGTRTIAAFAVEAR